MQYKYRINSDENGLSKTSKAKWKKIVKSKVIHQENQWYKTESSELSKLQEINKRKKRIKRYKYVTEFKRSGFSLLKKARLRMLNLKNKFKRQFKDDVSCPRCNLGIDDENHVFASYAKLENLHAKYEIPGFQDIFENINLEKLRKVIQFIKEANLESWVVKVEANFCIALPIGDFIRHLLQFTWDCMSCI